MNRDDDFDQRELAELFTQVVGEARSDGGLVTVTVDHRGCVSQVWLDPKLTGVSADRLAPAITAVCADAFDNRADRLAEVLDDYERTHGLAPDVLGFLQASVASLRRDRPQPHRPADEPPDPEGTDSPPAITVRG